MQNRERQLARAIHAAVLWCNTHYLTDDVYSLAQTCLKATTFSGMWLFFLLGNATLSGSFVALVALFSVGLDLHHLTWGTVNLTVEITVASERL